MPKEVIDAIKEIIPIKTTYEDAVQPLAKQIGRTGETLGLTINALFFPIRKFVYNIQAKEKQLEEDVTKRLARIPPDSIADQAPLHIVVPAVQAWSYSIDSDELKT